MNPWLGIPAADYEGHMASPAVDQLAFLSGVFRDALVEFRPRALAVLGCATGNGFEHLWGLPLERVVGIDIHPEYLAILGARHAAQIPSLELRCVDLAAPGSEPDALGLAGPGSEPAALDLAPGSLDLVSAALVFEYVDPAAILPRAARWLRPGGVLSWVLQLPSSAGAPVTETRFASLRGLEPLMKLVDPRRLEGLAVAAGWQKMAERTVTLPSGKSFRLGAFRRPA